MANTLLTIGGITRKALSIFRNTNSFIQLIDRQYDDQYCKTGAKIGAQLRIRQPNDYVVRTGQTAVPQNTTENYVTLTVSQFKGVDLQFSSTEMALSIDDFSERYVEPAVNALVGNVAQDVMTTAESIPNMVFAGTSNALASPTYQTFLNAGALLTSQPAPFENRTALTDQWTNARVTGTLTGFFNPTVEISNNYRKGMIEKKALGFDWVRPDQNVIQHTTGTFASGTVNATANQTGTAIGVTATTGTLVVGDLITFAGVYAVNRVTKSPTGQLAQFVITVAAPAGSTTLNIYPSLNPPIGGVTQQYQNVTASPAAGAAIAPVLAASTSYRKGFVYHPEFVTMVTADLEIPKGGIVAGAREAYDNTSLRMIQYYNGATDYWGTRLDILYGYLAQRPEFAVIVADVI